MILFLGGQYGAFYDSELGGEKEGKNGLKVCF